MCVYCRHRNIRSIIYYYLLNILDVFISMIVVQKKSFMFLGICMFQIFSRVLKNNGEFDRTLCH